MSDVLRALIPDDYPGILYANENRYHANASALKIPMESGKHPMVITYRGQTYHFYREETHRERVIRIEYRVGKEQQWFLLWNR
jgi:hypothetical protein